MVYLAPSGTPRTQEHLLEGRTPDLGMQKLERGIRDQQRWRERQKRGALLTTHTRPSSPQHLLQASFRVLPQSQNPLTPAFFLVLPTRSEHPISYRPAPWPATLRLLAAPHPPRPGWSSLKARREKRTMDRGASRRHTHETSKNNPVSLDLDLSHPLGTQLRWHLLLFSQENLRSEKTGRSTSRQ